MRIQGVGYTLFSIVSDGLYGTTFHCFFAHGFLLWRFGLLVDVRMASVVITLKICRSGFPAQITVDALIIHVKLACDVLSVSVCGISHSVVFVAICPKGVPAGLVEKVPRDDCRKRASDNPPNVQGCGLNSSFLVEGTVNLGARTVHADRPRVSLAPLAEKALEAGDGDFSGIERFLMMLAESEL